MQPHFWYPANVLHAKANFPEVETAFGVLLGVCQLNWRLDWPRYTYNIQHEFSDLFEQDISSLRKIMA
jgi:hypothetical protein